jgi:hypothetical protein
VKNTSYAVQKLVILIFNFIKIIEISFSVYPRMVKININSFCTPFELFFTDATEKYKNYVFYKLELLKENLKF